MYSFKHILNEAKWSNAYSVYETLKQYKGKNMYVHFHDGIKDHKTLKPLGVKFGVNPRKNHSDAHGIYFYPVDWLLKEDFNGYYQYALTNKYFYLVSLKPTANMLMLSDMTEADCLKLARKNGWLKEFTTLLTQFETVTQQAATCPGFELYYIAKELSKGKQVNRQRWKQMFRGYDGLIDNGKGIIFHNEPYQMVVFNKQAIKVELFDNNKHTPQHKDDILLNLQKIDANATVTWKHKVLHGRYTVNGKNHYLVYNPVNETIKASVCFNGIEVPYYQSFYDVRGKIELVLAQSIESRLQGIRDGFNRDVTNNPITLPIEALTNPFGLNSRSFGGIINNKVVEISGRKRDSICHYYFSLFDNKLEIILNAREYEIKREYPLLTNTPAAILVIAEQFKQDVLSDITADNPDDYIYNSVIRAMEYQDVDWG